MKNAHQTRAHLAVSGLVCYMAVAACALLPEPAGAGPAPRSSEVAVARSLGNGVEARIVPLGAPARRRHAREETEIAIRLGEPVMICVTAAVDGLVSLWSRVPGLSAERIFPNDYTPEARALRGGRLAAGREICIGDGQGGYRFLAAEPYGAAEIYVHVTQDPERQFAPEDIPVIPEFDEPVRPRSVSAGYSSRTLTYKVIQ